jgi:DNA/RNA endonuclease G (NUC1)
MHAAPEAALCSHGNPRLKTNFGHGPTTVISRPGYVLEHSSVDKIARWVCETVRREHVSGSAERSSFKPDPQLTRGSRAELADYRGSGYDRGHMAPASDFKHNQQRMNESFFLSNMIPQVGRGFNQSNWRVLEERVRDCVRERNVVQVITGAFFYDPAEENEDSADGSIDYFVIGDNQVAVPTHCYKILVARDHGTEQAVAFVMENKVYAIESDQDYDFAPFISSIDWLEERAGINFMPELDGSADEGRLEGDPGTVWECLQPGS